jgi:hypothetical protein
MVATASLLNLHLWLPRDVRLLVHTHLNILDRALVLCAHGMKWMWLLRKGGKPNNYEIMLLRTLNVKQKHYFSYARIGALASKRQLEWLRNNNHFPLNELSLHAAAIADNVDSVVWLVSLMRTRSLITRIGNTPLLLGMGILGANKTLRAYITTHDQIDPSMLYQFIQYKLTTSLHVVIDVMNARGEKLTHDVYCACIAYADFYGPQTFDIVKQLPHADTTAFAT